MSYVDSYAPSYSSNSKKVTYTDNFSDGVVLSKSGASGGFKKLLNLRCNNDKGLITRQVQKALDSQTQVKGTFHSFTKSPFYDKTVIHSGDGLYCADTLQNKVTLLYTGIPDKNSFMAEFYSKLYVYTSERVFCVDKDFTVSEQLPYAPLIYTGGNIGFQNFNGKRVKETDLNLIAPRISVSYSDKHSYDRNFCKLPVECDTSRPVEIKNAGTLISDGDYTAEADRITFKVRPEIENEEDLVISYYTCEKEKIGYPEVFSKLTLATAYGGSVISGTRIFATGNPDEPGKYYLSGLTDPLRFDESSYEILGNGSEAITGFARQYGYLVIFTSKSVLRMSYALTAQGAEFSVKEINSIIGCDCPLSICQIDNRVVFANSKGGVYIIDSTENFDEQNIKPISGNVSLGDGEGLLEMGAEKLKKACAADFGRMYCLCVGDKMYIWDYNKRGYSDNGNYSASQRKLVWYIYTDIHADFLFESGGKLCAYSQSNEGVSVFCEDSGENSLVKASLLSDEYDFSNPFDYKRVRQLRAEVEASSEPDILLKVLSDGEEYYKVRMKKVSRNGRRYELGAYLPYKKLKRFSFGMDFGGGISLKSVALVWSDARTNI